MPGSIAEQHETTIAFLALPPCTAGHLVNQLGRREADWWPTLGSAPRRQWRTPGRCTERRAMRIMVMVRPRPRFKSGSCCRLPIIRGTTNFPTCGAADSAWNEVSIHEQPAQNMLPTESACRARSADRSWTSTCIRILNPSSRSRSAIHKRSHMHMQQCMLKPIWGESRLASATCEWNGQEVVPEEAGVCLHPSRFCGRVCALLGNALL